MPLARVAAASLLRARAGCGGGAAATAAAAALPPDSVAGLLHTGQQSHPAWSALLQQLRALSAAAAGRQQQRGAAARGPWRQQQEGAAAAPLALPSAWQRGSRPRGAPRLPAALGAPPAAVPGEVQVLQPAPVPEGELMARIRAARGVGDMEALVTRWHSQFRANHVAAAVVMLPELDAEGLNLRRRFARLTQLLASSLLAIGHQLDAHQTAACLAALARPHCMAPPQAAPLQRLLLLLLEADGARLKQLHSHELAECAAAAAALQEAADQQQQQAARAAEAGSSDASAPPLASRLGSSALPAQLWHDGPSSAGTPLLAAGASSGSHALAAGGAGSDGALALAAPLQRLWLALEAVATPQLPTFAAPSLATTALAFAAAGRGSRQLLLAIVHAALARPRKFNADPLAVTRMLRALLLAQLPHEALLRALAASVASCGARGFSPEQAARVAAAFEQLGFYDAPACAALAKAACRSVKHWPPAAVALLLRSLAGLRHRDERLLAAATKALAAAAAAAQLTPAQLADALAALLQLGFSGSQLEGVVAPGFRWLAAVLPHERLPPGAAVKLLWAAAVLEAGDDALHAQLLSQLAGASAKQLSHVELRLLYQAHRLTTRGWLTQAGPGQQQASAAACADASSSAGGSSSGGGGDGWPRQLLGAARAAAAQHAAASAARSRRHIVAVQDAFAGLGLEPPVTGLAVDGGALQPDLAFVAPTGGRRGGAPLKVALMCDHAGRACRGLPHELSGYERVAGWLLEADGWRVVRLPGHEWALLADEGADGLGYVANALAAQGVPV